MNKLRLNFRADHAAIIFRCLEPAECVRVLRALGDRHIAGCEPDIESMTKAEKIAFCFISQEIEDYEIENGEGLERQPEQSLR